MPSPPVARPNTGRLAPHRRQLLLGSAALALGAMRLRFPTTAGAQDAASPTTDLCVLTPELTEGPFYLDTDLVRADITEGTPGLPLRLQIAVADVTTCAPLPNAAVDIWHCDAQGFYSGVDAAPGGGSGDTPASNSATFLRGIRLTDAAGIATFETIYPGWYSGRAVHIHMKVHVGGEVDAAEEFVGGHVSHTGQLFFDDAISDAVYSSGTAYANRDNAQRLRNDQDSILGDHADEPGFILALTPLTEAAPEHGYLGAITIGVDPTATP